MLNKTLKTKNKNENKTPRKFNKMYNPNLYPPRDDAKTKRNLLIFIGVIICGVIIQYVLNGYTFSTEHSLLNQTINFYKTIYLIILGL